MPTLDNNAAGIGCAPARFPVRPAPPELTTPPARVPGRSMRGIRRLCLGLLVCGVALMSGAPGTRLVAGNGLMMAASSPPVTGRETDRESDSGTEAVGGTQAVGASLGTSGGPAQARLLQADSPPTLRIQVLSRLRPARLELNGPQHLLLAAQADMLLVGGEPVPQPLTLVRGSWRVKVAGEPTRVFMGSLELSARKGLIEVVAILPMETYVAGVVASETMPETPPAALQALAVVVRSFAYTSQKRHPGADLCDLAHCQVFSARSEGRRQVQAAAAARATEGLVLRLATGDIAHALFHAGCGGHTADPVEVFGGSNQTGAEAVPDPGCPELSWSAQVPEQDFLSAVSDTFGEAGLAALPAPPLASLQLRPGKGGFISQVYDPSSGRTGSGDALFRSLGRRLGWGLVRSGRMQVRPVGARVEVTGSGLGHGVGLCQEGAARRARDGQHMDAILKHFFPRARVGRP